MSLPDSLQRSLPNEINVSFLPSHLVERALALAKPVEKSDEPLLVETIVYALRKDKDASYRKILGGMHGRNGHSASLWKDYYLDHKKHIDSLVRTKKKGEPAQIAASKVSTSGKEREAGPSTTRQPAVAVPAIKKPSHMDDSPPVFHTSASAPPKRARSKTDTLKERHLTPIAAIPASGSRRTTLNSLTTFDPVFNSQLPAPHTEIKIPDLPSREPSPPTNVVSNNLGNRFTQEDREFFIKFIQRRFLEDPNMSRKDICDKLAEKAPHHPSNSWNSYWSNNHDLPDKIATAAANGLWPFGTRGKGDYPTSAGVVRNSVLKRPNYRESSSSEEDEDVDDAYSSNDEDGSEGARDDDSDDYEPVRRYTESQMSEPRTPFNEADMYMVAKYITNFPQFESASNNGRWGPFEEMHPQRTDKSWAEYFRRYEKDVRRLVKRMRRDEQSQRVRPESGGPPRKKRREGSRA